MQDTNVDSKYLAIENFLFAVASTVAPSKPICASCLANLPTAHCENVRFCTVYIFQCFNSPVCRIQVFHGSGLPCKDQKVSGKK